MLHKFTGYTGYTGCTGYKDTIVFLLLVLSSAPPPPLLRPSFSPTQQTALVASAAPRAVTRTFRHDFPAGRAVSVTTTLHLNVDGRAGRGASGLRDGLVQRFAQRLAHSRKPFLFLFPLLFFVASFEPLLHRDHLFVRLLRRRQRRARKRKLVFGWRHCAKKSALSCFKTF